MDSWIKDLTPLITAIGTAVATILGGYAVIITALGKREQERLKSEVGAVKQVLGAVIEKTPDEMDAILKEADRLAAFAAGRRAAVEERNAGA